MAKHGKKYLAALAKVDLDKEYSTREAVALAKETSTTKFNSTVEVHLRTALDPRQADQQVRDVVVLPHGLGRRRARSAQLAHRLVGECDQREDRRAHDQPEDAEVENHRGGGGLGDLGGCRDCAQARSRTPRACRGGARMQSRANAGRWASVRPFGASISGCL